MHLVVFDIDGTLTRTNDVDEICFVQAIADEFAIAGISTDWCAYRNVTDSGILQEVVQSRYARLPDPTEIGRVQLRFCRLLEEAFSCQPGVCEPIRGGLEMLQRLEDEADQALALATGGWELTALAKLHGAGYRTEKMILASASDACAREEIMLLAKERSRAQYGVAEFESVTYVGDGLWDYEASASLGWRFVGIAAGEQAAALRQRGATDVVSWYGEVDFLHLIRRVQQA